MKKAILATKVGMTQIFNADGVLVPVLFFRLVHVLLLRSKQLRTTDTVQYRLDLLTRKKKLLTKTLTAKKKSETDMALTKLRWDTLQKLVYPERDL